MVSVLTLTYKRQTLLEEAINSFLLQNSPTSEMVIINDHPEVEYIFDHPQIKIHNCSERFSSISEKLKWGFNQCKFDYMYRLDDDDLLAPNAIKLTEFDIRTRSWYDIYRTDKHYYFENNRYVKIGGMVNNGNVYTKSYINRITFPDKSWGEDIEITFNNEARIFNAYRKPTMIYRWGMSTYHVSEIGDKPNNELYKWADKLGMNSSGKITLIPKFENDYYSMLP
jgi:glycosyltransferase involved in cell wall biosynthesis